jgi:6,7-dimethyl-8-ribityllumazine synthase
LSAANAPNSETTERRVAMVVSKYNHVVTQQLLDGALKKLKLRNIAPEAVDVVWVPGAWEIPLAASQFLKQKRHIAVVCLGAVIRGETTHDQHINRTVSMLLGQLAIEFGVPVAFGVLTCNSLEQALQRAGGSVGNKGAEAVDASLEMVQVLGSFRTVASR